MKSIVLSSVVTALLVFSGCSDKEPVVEEPVKQEAVKEVESVKTETVSSEQSTISTSGSMSNIEGRLSSIYFDFDKYAVRSDMQGKVSADANIVKNEAASFNIKLEGNCDEWGSDEYNFALGLKRADSVKKALIAEGVDAGKISMVSYGESNPTCKDKTRECWSKNRRVDFTLLP